MVLALALLPSLLVIAICWALIRQIRETRRERWCGISRRRLDSLALVFGGVGAMGLTGDIYVSFFVSLPSCVAFVVTAILIAQHIHYRHRMVEKSSPRSAAPLIRTMKPI